MITTVTKNSEGDCLIRLSEKILNELKFTENDMLEAIAENDSIVIKRTIDQPVIEFHKRFLNLFTEDPLAEEKLKNKGFTAEELRQVENLKNGLFSQDFKDLILLCYSIGCELVFKSKEEDVNE